MLEKVVAPQRYEIFREKTIGRRLVRQDCNPSDRHRNIHFHSKGELEKVRFQLKEVTDSLEHMITNAPLTASGKILVDPREFKHLFKCLGVADIHLEFINQSKEKGGRHGS